MSLYCLFPYKPSLRPRSCSIQRACRWPPVVFDRRRIIGILRQCCRNRFARQPGGIISFGVRNMDGSELRLLATKSSMHWHSQGFWFFQSFAGRLSGSPFCKFHSFDYSKLFLYTHMQCSLLLVPRNQPLLPCSKASSKPKGCIPAAGWTHIELFVSNTKSALMRTATVGQQYSGLVQHQSALKLFVRISAFPVCHSRRSFAHSVLHTRFFSLRNLPVSPWNRNLDVTFIVKFVSICSPCISWSTTDTSCLFLTWSWFLFDWVYLSGPAFSCVHDKRG